MKPVFQDKFYDASLPDDKQRGNCLSAVVASLLEIPLADVPNFVAIDDDGGMNWHEHWVLFLRERGYNLHFWPMEDKNSPILPVPGEYYLVSGKSTRGNFFHIVVYQDGRMVHDPHPDGTGILTEDDMFLVRKI